MGERTLLGCKTWVLSWRGGIGRWREPELRARQLLQVGARLPALSKLLYSYLQHGEHFSMGHPLLVELSPIVWWTQMERPRNFRSGN